MPLNETIEKYKNLNFVLITINLHPSDMDQFNNLLNSYFLPYIVDAPYYAMTTEYNETLHKHLHCVLGYDKKFARDIGTIRSKVNGQKIKNILYKIYNSNECAFDVKPLKDDTKDEKKKQDDRDTKWGHIFTSTGYCVKQGTGYLQTNITCEEFLEQSRLSYINKMKKPIVNLEHNYEHKQLSKGNVLNYIYDASIKHPEIPIVQLEHYTIKHMKYSYVNVPQYTKTQAMKELYIIRSDDQKIHEKYENQDKMLITPHEKNIEQKYEELSHHELVDQCVIYEERINQFQEFYDKIIDLNNIIKNNELSEILNAKYNYI